MTIKPEEITASLRRMADVETSVLYSQRTTLIGAADEIERLQAENAKYKDLYRVQSGQMIELMAENSALIQRLAPIVMGRGSNRDTIAAKSQKQAEEIAFGRGLAEQVLGPLSAVIPVTKEDSHDD